MAARMEPGTCLRDAGARKGFVNCRSTASRPVVPDNRAMTQRQQHSEPWKRRPGSSCLLPHALDSILVEDRIGTDQRELLDHRLSDQQAVERVFVVRRQRLHERRMSQLDPQQTEPVRRQFPRQEGCGRFAEGELLQPGLDSDFPAGRYAHELLIRRVFDPRLGGRAEVRVVPDEPEERMGVEEQVHSIYSLNSSSGASKSGAIQWMVPLALPALHGHCVFGSVRASFATGSSFSVMTTSSPGVRRWINSLSLFCASSMVTIGMIRGPWSAVLGPSSPVP